VESVHTVAPVGRRSRRAALLARLLEQAGVACEIVLPDGERLAVGPTHPGAPPRFRAVIRRPRALARGLDEFALGRAYVEGDIDLEGDLDAVFALRGRLAERSPLAARLRFVGQLLAAPTRMNRRAIDHHYTLGDDFYLGFIDQRYRFYSHGLFHDDAETLEEASEHKLERMWNALELEPGMRLLDIGGGWGGVPQYCGERGVHVTSLTIAEDSRRYIERLIAERGLPAEVRLEDFLEHRPARPYDAVVIYGVIEHIPQYRRFCARAWECLPPGGRLYMDASASKEKFRMSAFTRHYIWHGTHTFLALQDVVQELLWQGFELLEVQNESRDYELTMRGWAERFDARRAAIVERWGERVYRAFRVYLWGGCHAFRVDRLQAYSLVARRGPNPGPRPGVARRAQAFAVGLRG
jgi:cyclopropane fatty-acyl-phospholipid synthase-like methyltransferase